jgi:hypothetical protein
MHWQRSDPHERRARWRLRFALWPVIVDDGSTWGRWVWLEWYVSNGFGDKRVSQS